MPTCSGCGEDFGNAGALATHENSCDELQAQQQPQQARQPAPAQPQQARHPPARGQPGGQAGGQVPATPQSTEQAVQTGTTIADALTGMNSGDPAERAESKGTIMKTLGVAIAKVGEQTEQRQKQAVETARNASSDQLTTSDEYPDCPECDGQITRIPSAEFPCPHCGTQLVLE